MRDSWALLCSDVTHSTERPLTEPSVATCCCVAAGVERASQVCDHSPERPRLEYILSGVRAPHTLQLPSPSLLPLVPCT